MIYRVKARGSIYVDIDGPEDKAEEALERVASGDEETLSQDIDASLEIEFEACPHFGGTPRYLWIDDEGRLRRT